MDKLFAKINFTNPSDDEEEFVRKTLEEFDDEKVQPDDIIALIKMMAEKLKDSLPQRNEKGHFLYGRINSKIMNCIRSADDEESFKLAITPSILKFIEISISGVFGAAHADIIKEWFRYCSVKYFEDISEKDFQSLLSIYYNCDFKMSNDDKQLSYAKSTGISFFKTTYLESVRDELFERYTHPHVFDLYKHLMVKMWDSDETTVKIFENFVVGIQHHYKYHHIAFCTDVEQYKAFFNFLVDKLVESDVKYSDGQTRVKDYFISMSTVIREKLDVTTALIEDWIGAIMKLYPLCESRTWMISIVERLLTEIRVMSDEQCKVIYKQNDGSSLGVVAKFMSDNVTDKVGKEKDKDPYKQMVTNLQNYLFNEYLLKVCKTKENMKAIYPLIEKYISVASYFMTYQNLEKLFANQSKILQELWKEDISYLSRLIIDFINSAKLSPEWPEVKKEEENLAFVDRLDYLQRRLKNVLEISKKGKLYNHASVQEPIVNCLIETLGRAEPAEAYIISELWEYIIWQKVPPKKLMAIIDSLFGFTKTTIENPFWPDWIKYFGNFMNDFLKAFNNSLDKCRAKIPVLSDICEECIDKEYMEENMFSVHGMILHSIFCILLQQTNDDEIIGSIYPFVLRACKKIDGEDSILTCWNGMLSKAPQTEAGFLLLANHMEGIIERLEDLIIENEDDSSVGSSLGLIMLVNSVSKMAQHKLVPFMPNIQKMMEHMISQKQPLYLLALATTAANCVLHDSSCVTESFVSAAMSILSATDETCIFYVAPMIIAIADKKAALLQPYYKELSLSALKHSKIFLKSHCTVFEKIVANDGNEAVKIFPIYEDLMKELLNSPDEAIVLLMSMRQLAFYNHSELAARRSLIMNWSAVPAFKDECDHLIDVIDNRTLKGVDEDLGDQKGKVNELGERVDATGQRVDNLDEQVGKQDVEINNLGVAVKATDQEVTNVKGTVGELSEQVEEIDHKTMSNAPAWSRDVTKLLNPETDTDWRLLGKRLGYSADNIRSWATQSDPCMALLSEWYATHRTLEATRAVLTQLKEMNRLDAAVIVEKALVAAEGTASDEVVEYTEPPPIFLSYQWGSQDEVKLLCNHLKKAGYRCWMDVGQMGGGDKLFEAIDRGIRGAQVMISCVTPKYAQSDNCKRELNLAINLGKPLIPLQMERMEWPPAGPMGPLLTEYIFIRLFKKQQDNSGVFWPPERFTELLMQIRYHAAPCFEEVQSEYANWWQPPEEDMEKIKEAILAKQKQSKKSEVTEVPKDSSIIETVDPQVFLSYQWDNQSNIKALYMRLTSLGYTCWMDIYMMGGGDSLYDKIDRGIRKCDVVVSCATLKYSQSANCRREVSLADALKKPIIPLILKEMPWPPEGPMSMPFSQLLYINFCKNLEELNTWDGALTDQLIEQIAKHTTPVLLKTPNKLPEKKTSTSKKDESKNQPNLKKAVSAADEKKSPAKEKTDEKKSPAKEKPAEKKMPQNEMPKKEASKDTSLEDTRSKACILL